MDLEPSSNTISVFADFSNKTVQAESIEVEEHEIPILPLRNMMLFPGTILPVNVGRASAQTLLSEAQDEGWIIGVFGQKRTDVEQPTEKDLYHTGVVGKVVKILKLPDGSQTAFLQGLIRVRLEEAHQGRNYMMGRVKKDEEVLPAEDDKEFRATLVACKEIADKFLQTHEGAQVDSQFEIKDVGSGVFFINFISSSLPLSGEEHLELLETNTLKERAVKLLAILNRELQFARLKASIQMQTHAELNQQQREYFLKREMENIKDELGEGHEDEVSSLRERATKKSWSKAAQEKFEQELARLEHTPDQSPEYSTIYDYLDTLLKLPWDNVTKDRLDIAAARKVLDKDHYGLDKVKERILEHLAVLKLRGDFKSPILCLYGPPGVGKTSLGKSIARAMKRKYVRVSLGGLHDEAEIRGHRRTYIGSMPGRILTGINEAGSSNPVFILDEIDKVGAPGVQGDPASALLEVLDPEQNTTFHDNYVDVDYDLSKVLFIATANNISTIPAPLRDRMELIEVNGYLAEEKKEIAKRHLIPKELKNVGLQRTDVSISKDAIAKIIEDYTRESGVRELEKKINKIMRKVALEKVSATSIEVSDTEDATSAEDASAAKMGKKIKAEDVKTYLGVEEYSREHYENNDYAGVVTGLAWTQVGGEILFVETSLSKGKGEKLTLTGNLGDVMKESAAIALEYVRAHAEQLGIDSTVFEQQNIHVHVPEGAVPKDGPSAGITLATSIASALTHRKVRPHLAMTGEITLRGRVMPVGGIKEKILAAKRAGITDIVLSSENQKNIEEIPSIYLGGLTFHYVNNVNEVLQFALLDEKATI